MIEEKFIRERAHRIWESEGRPSDRAEAHWALASAQLAEESERARRPTVRKAAAAAPAPRVKAKAAAPRKPRKPATTD